MQKRGAAARKKVGRREGGEEKKKEKKEGKGQGGIKKLLQNNCRIKCSCLSITN